MRQFDWAFPTQPISLEFDTATDGFASFLKGVRSACPGDDLTAAIGGYNADWSNILSFLASMYALPARSSHRKPIIECVHRLWKIDQNFQDLLERQVQDAIKTRDPVCLPWLQDDEWRDVHDAGIEALAQMEVASTALVQELAPTPFDSGRFLGPAQKCFRCGRRLGYIFERKGFGWRQSSHDARCLERMLD